MKIARVNLEAEVWGDHRFAHLERLLGYPACKGHLAIARMAIVWGWQVEHYTPEAPCFHVPEDVLEMALEVDGERAVAALVRARLAEETPDGVRIKGSSHEATGWLWRVRERSAAGVDAKREKASKRKPADTSQPMVHHGSTASEPHGSPGLNPLSSLLSDLPDSLSLGERARDPSTPAPAPMATGTEPDARPVFAPLAAYVTLAVGLLNAARHELDPAAQPVDADQGDEMAAAAHLRALPEDRRETAIRHGVAAITAAVKAGRETLGALRPGELFGPRSWRKWQAAPTVITARGRDGPGGGSRPARGLAAALDLLAQTSPEDP